MACNRVGNRVISYKQFFIVILSTTLSFSLCAGTLGFGLELQYDDEKGLSAALSGSYKTDYVIGKINIKHAVTFPDNILINFEPTSNSSSNQKALIAVLTGFTDGSVILGKYYLKKIYYHNEKLENELINSYLKKRQKNLQLLKESSHD